MATQAQTTTKLELSFEDIMRHHDLTVLTVGKSAGSVLRWTVNAHWEGYTNTGHNVAFGYGDCIQEAMHDCLHHVGEARVRAPFHPQLDHDDPLPEPVQ